MFELATSMFGQVGRPNFFVDDLIFFDVLRQQTSVETAVLWKETEVHVSPRMFFSSVRICPFHPFQPVRVDLEVCQFLSENSRGCSMPVNWQFCLRCYVSFRGCTFGQTLKTPT